MLPCHHRYLIGGAVVGPSGLGLVTNWEQVGAVAQFGAVFPLFSMGLEFKPTDHRYVGAAGASGVRGTDSPLVST